MLDCFSLDSWSEEFSIQAFVDSKKDIKAFRGTGLPIIIYSTMYLCCLFKFAICSVSLELPSTYEIS